jgi:hypothetical protein
MVPLSFVHVSIDLLPVGHFDTHEPSVVRSGALLWGGFGAVRGRFQGWDELLREDDGGLGLCFAPGEEERDGDAQQREESNGRAHHVEADSRAACGASLRANGMDAAKVLCDGRSP